MVQVEAVVEKALMVVAMVLLHKVLVVAVVHQMLVLMAQVAVEAQAAVAVEAMETEVEMVV